MTSYRMFALAFGRRVPVWFERGDDGMDYLVGACGWVGLNVPIVVEADTDAKIAGVIQKLDDSGYANVERVKPWRT